MPEDPKSKHPTTENVGKMLKARRQALKLSLSQVELETKIRGKFLTALETGEYKTLPNDIYSRGFVQHYANHLGLDGAFVAAQYVAERGGIGVADTNRPRLAKSVRFVFTGKILTATSILVMVSAVIWYLLAQFSVLAAAPYLTITSPNADRVMAGAVISVSGRTTPGADVSINDSPVLTDSDGNFSEKVALRDGINTIRVVAKSKLGKVTNVTRNVLAKLPKVDAAQAIVPAAVFDGVAVAVSVKETTSMVVTVDGKDAWRGTVLPGWSAVYTGKNDISITTGNAGATRVTVTNAAAANKEISPLGSDGEIRRNQSFAKDTVIP